jgi:hypothetical protein
MSGRRGTDRRAADLARARVTVLALGLVFALAVMAIVGCEEPTYCTKIDADRVRSIEACMLTPGCSFDRFEHALYLEAKDRMRACRSRQVSPPAEGV